MSYLRTGLRCTRWLLICAPLLGSGVILNACLSDTTTPAGGGDDTTGGAGDGTTVAGSGGSDNPGAGGTDAVVAGSGGAMSSGAGGTGSGTGGNVSSTGGSTGAGGSGQMTGSTAGTVAGGMRWVGRIDATDPKAIKFNWGGSGFVASVTGTSVTVQLNNDNPTFFQPVVDGKPGTRLKAGKGMSSLAVATGLAAGTHTVELYRETEAAQSGVTTFLGITGATMNPAPTYTGRLVECIGDSLSNGYGELSIETHPGCSSTVNGCTYSIDTQSNYMSYVAVAARALNADWSIVANSGWGLSRDLANGVQNVMPNVYGEAYYVGNGAPMWGFGVKANAVIINLGTNDTARGDPGVAYQTAFVKLVGDIRTKNGTDAWIFPVTGSMIGGNNTKILAGYINAGIATLKDPKVFYVDLGTQDACGAAGTGCDWHPSTAEHQRLANLMVPVIKSKLGW